jgi:aryl-alcohol dehydrogenase-like predicted oxidoreductase
LVAAIARAVEVGINYFDTAATYGTGERKKIFGEGLSGTGISTQRDYLYIATKVSQSEANPRESIDNFLKNLKPRFRVSTRHNLHTRSFL